MEGVTAADRQGRLLAARYRPHHPRHHARDERADRAQGRSHRVASPPKAFATRSRSATSIASSSTTSTSKSPSRWCRAGGATRVPERMSARGRGVARARRGRGAGVDPRCSSRNGVASVAVGSAAQLRQSCARAAHPRASCREHLPHVWVSLSSEVSPELREYERFSTACANAYVQPLMAGYLDRLDRALRAGRLRRAAPAHDLGRWRDRAGGRAAISDPAGRIGPGRRRNPGEPHRARVRARARAVLRHGRHHGQDLPDRPGPAAELARLRGRTRLPVSEGQRAAAAHSGDRDGRDRRGRRLHRQGRCSQARCRRPGQRGRCAGPRVLRTRRPGGDRHRCGSRARPDRSRSRSQVAVSRSTPARPLRRSIDRSASRLRSARSLAALAISEIVDENMASAARVHAVERGKSLDERTLVAFGGAAPLHATRVADKLGITHRRADRRRRGSAVGMLGAPVAYEVARSLYQRVRDLDAAR